ncbi:asparagine synthase (glutamine-hydrolyzing) [Chitinophagaceae bacterium LB-8]|uniref:asparagine synthase (glutamine-hydrolyzing) n=1 Tax=Paraflavisolibacter caeni TaxID=2982496 RepID=A0A9X3B8K4_9BACT|nr:asparagine synthase (glutamine-hydrolyzing) [Paraflavisolibacter caeni]MCU7550850.1 asparagine synthase (glutamine-hydrolyzing) [Paraflavisolibacter caeni]
MCGIAGFINFQENEMLANAACTKQKHRGPDAQSIWKHNNIALSHQRLSIIDLEARSNQPLIKDGLAIIFNGEIYNYQELKNELLNTVPHLNFITTSDTEVLLELYRYKKEKCLDLLLGMFAFAIYEIKTGKLFIARDHFGIKPLFYTQINNSFAFSSELKTLTNIPGFDKTLNTSALVGAINYLWVPGNESMFCNCFKLPPAHYMVIDTNEETIKTGIIPYWKLDTRIQYTNEEQITDLLTNCIEASIRRHMVADVPVSSFLSGGLDSSLISVLASKTNPRISTYTIATSDTDKLVEQMPEDEKYARLLADQFHFDHNEILLNANIVKDLPSMVHILDEPIGDPAAINTYLICKAAREKGVKVILSGMGADEIFFGYRRQKATLLALYYRKIPPVLRRPINWLIQTAPVKAKGKGIRLIRWTKRFLSFAELPLEEAYMRSYSYYDEEEIHALFTQNIQQSYASLRQHHAQLFNAHYGEDVVNKMCYTDIYMFMLGLNLTYTDRASMAASVEVRVPFIDKDVISLAMKIDGNLKYKGGKSKYILKKVAEKYLPHQIIYRPKASFGAPIRSWISGELKGMVNELLSKEAVEKRGLFNYSFVKRLIENDRKGIEDNAYRIYQLLTIELWCREYLDVL